MISDMYSAFWDIFRRAYIHSFIPDYLQEGEERRHGERRVLSKMRTRNHLGSIHVNADADEDAN